jgi:MYXO-CTERM domain-containing protein
MKTVNRLAQSGVVLIALAVTPAIAQPPPAGPSTVSPNDPARTPSPYSDRRTGDDDFNWGWLGLLGLAGLAGMMRRTPDRGRTLDRDADIRTTPTNPNRL